MSKKTRLSADTIDVLVKIGFCQPKFYKPASWARAKRFMDSVVCPAGLAKPFDFGRGKGKYTTSLDVDDVVSKVVCLYREQGLLEA